MNPPSTIRDHGTPERLAHANDNFEIDSKTGTKRMTDAPLAWLASRGELDPKSQSTNKILLAAGERFYADFYAAGLQPLGAIDYGKAIVDGTAPGGESDRRVAALARYNRAAGDMDPAFAEVVNPVVLHEAPLVDVGRRITGRRDVAQARAVAIDRLRLGLAVIARSYGMFA